MEVVEAIRRRYEAVRGVLNERQIRLWAAAEAIVFGRGGIARVKEATGLSSVRIRNGLSELEENGGSNSPRSRLWRTELQKFADEAELDVTFCLFPPGTSKWNKIEHRLFAQLTQNWRGRPLSSQETVVELIRTTTGLRAKAKLDERPFRTGKKVSDVALAMVSIKRSCFHGAWNYQINHTKRNR